ncbi:MAG: T9SS type A sorting domain-containing protein [Bacteroidales bacterium]|nr:T9SS type A sorting domain-containing protein [Bacteroidales bacterium]
MKTRAICAISMLLFIASFSTGNSQNYRVLKPEQTTFYSIYSDLYFGMRVDSVSIQGTDTIFHLLKNLQQMDFDCFHTDGPSWMGDRIIVRPDGETSFFNGWNEEIAIKTQAPVGEEWMCYTNPLINFRATVASLGTETFLGVTDSVKTISFQAVSPDGLNISSMINWMQIKLSKNNGIITTFNFYSFPEVGLGLTRQTAGECHLIGMDNPISGIQNLTWKEIHDHNPGDELHTVEIYSDISYSLRVETLSRLLEKSIDGDTIFYYWEKRIKVMINGYGNNTFSANIDTLLQKIYSNSGFDQLPGMAMEVENSEYFTTTLLKDGFHGIIKAQMGGSGTVEPSYYDSCYHHPIFDNCFPDQEYYKGLGGPYYSEYFGFDECSNQLVYYKKDGVEWGFPLDFTVNTTLKPIETEPELVSVFPNPATDLVNIKLSILNKSSFMTIIDSHGVETGNYPLNAKESQINIQNLKPGIYLFRFTSENQNVIRKIVKL